jgi:hypothetical protein
MQKNSGNAEDSLEQSPENKSLDQRVHFGFSDAKARALLVSAMKITPHTGHLPSESSIYYTFSHELPDDMERKEPIGYDEFGLNFFKKQMPNYNGSASSLRELFTSEEYKAAQNDFWCLKHYSSGISDIRIEEIMFAVYGDEKQAYYATTFRLDEKFLREKIQLPEDVYTTHGNYILGIPDLRVMKDIWLGEITEDGLTILQHITN